MMISKHVAVVDELLGKKPENKSIDLYDVSWPSLDKIYLNFAKFGQAFFTVCMNLKKDLFLT